MGGNGTGGLLLVPLGSGICGEHPEGEMADLQVDDTNQWAPLAGVTRVRLTPPVQTNVQVEIPGSKSLTNRALILAALAEGKSTLHGLLKSDDSYWCLEALRALGVEIDVTSGAAEIGGDSTAVVVGCNGQWPVRSGAVFTGSSGTLSRFLPPALAATEGSWTLRATPQMARRPVLPLLEALTQWGAQVSYLEKPGYYPFAMKANGLSGGVADVPGNVSSQYLSGLLMAAPYARSTSEIRVEGGLVQPAYIRLTLNLMEQFGVTVESVNGFVYRVSPQRYRGVDVRLEADASTAAYFFALAAVSKGRVRVVNLGADTIQPDIGLLDILEQMGAVVHKGPGWTEVVGPSVLRGGFTVSLHALSDQALTVGVLAALSDGPITVTDVGHIRAHESNRIAALRDCLNRVGIVVDERDDGFTVYPGPIHAAALPTHDDHRVAMSMALLGAAVPGIELCNPGCVAKTCPDFFDRFAAAGVGVERL